jgi:hypothetical protein
VLDLGMSCAERAWSTAAGVAGAKPAVRIGLPRTASRHKASSPAPVRAREDMHVAARRDHDVTGRFLMIVELSGGIVLPVEAADLVAEGLANQAIARRLPVAPRTAEAHVDNIRRKLEVALASPDRGVGHRAPAA